MIRYNVNLSMNTMLLIGAGVAVYYVLSKPGIVSVIGDTARNVVTRTLNPASTDNVVYRGVQGAVRTATGSQQSLGAMIYDLFHPNEFPWLNK